MDSRQKKQNPADLIKELEFCVFDLETTGGNHKSDKIIEIGLVKIRNLEIVEEKDFLVDPEIRIPDFIQKLTNIKQPDVTGKPLIQDLVDEIVEFMGDSILVAHNTSFDVPFFNSVLRRLDRAELKNNSICTNLMTKYLIPNLLNSNLNYMSKIFNINHKKAHRALDDANATAELLINYLGVFIDKGIQKVNHLYYPRNRYELDRVHFKSTQSKGTKEIIGTLKGLQSPSLVTLKGENGIILFALPCIGSEKEPNLLEEYLEKVPWETATIKLYGSLIESIIHFNNLFSKMDPLVRSDLIRFLWSQHLSDIKRPQHINEDDLSIDPLITKDLGDFLIVNHLVPEQMIILPIQALHIKNQLIFRYPSHKKKLIQYINSKASRISNNKLKQHHYHPLLKEFLDHYLLKESEKTKSLFFFKRKLPLTKPDEFVTQLNDFLAKNPNPHNYPKEYI